MCDCRILMCKLEFVSRGTVSGVVLDFWKFQHGLGWAMGPVWIFGLMLWDVKTGDYSEVVVRKI